MKIFLKFGLCAALAAVLIGSAYAYMGNPRIEGPDMVVSADTVTNRVGDEVTLTAQWKYEFYPPDTEITNQFQPIAPASCSNWFVSPSPEGTGFRASSGGTNYYTNLVHFANPVYFKASEGGEYSIAVTAWSDLFEQYQANTLHVTSLHVDIEQSLTNMCWQMASAGLNLTTISYWAPPGSGGGVTWSSSPAGLSGSGSGGTFTFNPSASTPGSYVVTAQSTLLPICTDTCMVRVLKVDIEQAETNVYWKQTTAELNLTEESFWAAADGGSITWESAPAGLSGSGSGGTYTFNPSASTQGTYVVTARSSLLPDCQDVCTVRIYKLVAKSFSGTETPNGQLVDLTVAGTYDSWLTAGIESGDLTPSPASYQGVGAGTYPFIGIAAPRNETLASLDMRVTQTPGPDSSPPVPITPGPEKIEDQSSIDPINTENGDMYLTETDLVLPCPGLSLEWRRMYHSVTTNAVAPLSSPDYLYPAISSESPNLGAGWTHSYNWRVVATNIQYRSLSPDKAAFLMEEDPCYHGQIVEAGTNVYYVDWIVDYDEDGNVIYPPPRVIASIDLEDLMDWNSKPCLVLKSWNGDDYYFMPEIGLWRYAVAGLNWQLDKTTNGYTLTIPDSQEMVFDTNGYLTRIQDTWSNRVDLTYEGTGTNALLTRIEHNNGQALTLTYSGQRVTEVSTSNDLAVSYSYSGNNLVESRRTVSGRDQVTQYAYGPFLTNRVNAISNCSRYTYATNSAGNPTPRCNGLQLTETPTSQSPLYYQHTVLYSNLAWGAFGNTYLCYQRDGVEQLFKYVYNRDRTLGEIRGPLNTNGIGPQTVFTYDSYGNVTQETREEVSGETLNEQAVYGPNRNVLSNGVGYCGAPTHWWQTTWDDDAKYPTASIDPEGHRIDYAFPNGRLTRAWSTSGGQTAFDIRFSYTSVGQLAAVTNSLGHWVRYEYDTYGNPSKITPQVGPEVVYGFNSLGYMTSMVMPENRTTVFSPDVLGRVQSIVWPDGVGESFQYDALGNLTNHTDRAGRSTQLAWLPTRKLASVTRWLGSQAVSIHYDYDQQFNTLKIRDALNRPVESYVLDLQDRPVTVSNVDGQTMQIRYGVESIVHSIDRFDGSTVSNFYDGDARLVRQTAGNLTTSYGYFGDGSLHSASNEAGAVILAYDALNRLVALTNPVPNGALAYAYDSAGNVTSVVSAAGTTGYEYDEAERLTELSTKNEEQGITNRFEFVYNPTNGLVETVSNTVSGMRLTVERDVLDRLTQLRWVAANGAALRGFGYQHNLAGMITNLTRESGEQTAYTYDSLDRLTGERQVDSKDKLIYSAEFSYDLAGNRTAATMDDAQVTYTLDAGNRLTGWVTVEGVKKPKKDKRDKRDKKDKKDKKKRVTRSFAWYDAAGNTTSILYNASSKLDLAWDARYQLATAKINGALAESYGYDALGRRISISDGATTNYMVYDGLHVVADVASDGSLTRSYVYGPGIDNILSMTVYGGTTSTYYYIKDHLGSVQAIVDSTGLVVESYQYDAWGNTTVYDGSGNPLQQSQIGNRFAWQGREYSWATRLYYFRARWYDPNTGRWLSNDPIGISGGLNQYVFCADNPVNFRDPLGLCKSGEDEAQRYVQLLHRDKWWLLTHPWRGYEWSMSDGKDLVNSPDSFDYRGRVLTGPQQGNVDAAYAFTKEFGSPMAGVAVSLLGEGAGAIAGVSSWEDAKGSFKANALGIWEASKELLRDYAIEQAVRSAIPFPLPFPISIPCNQ